MFKFLALIQENFFLSFFALKCTAETMRIDIYFNFIR